MKEGYVSWSKHNDEFHKEYEKTERLYEREIWELRKLYPTLKEDDWFVVGVLFLEGKFSEWEVKEIINEYRLSNYESFTEFLMEHGLNCVEVKINMWLVLMSLRTWKIKKK